MNKTRTAASLAVLVLLAVPAIAEEIVVFKNGQAMRVDKTRRDGKWLYISIASEQEMGVLAHQVKGVEPAEPLPQRGRDAAVAANLVSSGGGAGYVSPPVAESFEVPEGGEEIVSPQVSPQEAQQQVQGQAPQQGQDLVPRSRRAGQGGRTRRTP
jgi:hypothetical protein